MIIAITAFSVCVVVGVLLLLRLEIVGQRASLERLRAELKETTDALGSLTVHYLSLKKEAEPLLWAKWWARNAAEQVAGNHPEMDREALQRVAIAALCADDVETLQKALQREALQVDLHASEVAVPAGQEIAGVFRSALQELTSPEKAWDAYARNCPGRPLHAPAMVAKGVGRALAGRFVHWEGQSNSGLAGEPFENHQ